MAKGRKGGSGPGRLRAVWDEKRKELGLTQAALGDSLGVSQATVSEYLNGEIPLNIPAALKFAELLGVTLDEIWEGEVPALSQALSLQQIRDLVLSRSDEDQLSLANEILAYLNSKGRTENSGR